MDLVNKLKSAVSTVLPVGNPITTEHEVHAHRASAGPGLLWKIYDGIKKSTKQNVSIFICEKKLLERYRRCDRELILESLRKGVSQLTRLRHPKILSVLHPLEESRESLAFATEPVFASLANVLNHHDNLPNPPPPALRDFKLYDVEIKYGILQVTEGLAFLHNDAKMIHGNICPESILLTKAGSWKLSGFDFCTRNTNTADQSPFYPFREWNSKEPPVSQPRLDYLAPEFTLTKTCDTSGDMFSLGVLFFAIFNNGTTIYQCCDELNAFQSNVKKLKNLQLTVLGSIPEDARDHVKMLLNTEPSVRPDADQLSKVNFFDDVGAKMLQYMDTLVQRNNLEKSQFFKNLPKIIAKMPKRVCLQRILPCLLFESSTANMVPFILPNLFEIGEMTTNDEFTQHILPVLIPLFKMTDPIQIILLFLQHMTLLLSKTPQSDIRHHVLPMVWRAVECDTPQIQELCLAIIPTFSSLIEYSSMKNALVPRIKKLMLGTTSLTIRVNCLVCLGKLMEQMDKWYVLDEILPMMPSIPSKEPAVLMGILGIFKVAFSHSRLGITKEMLATKVIPFLFPLCIDNNLNLQQFNAFMETVNEMAKQVETEQRNKLEQLDTMQQEQRTLQKFAEDASVPGSQSSGTEESKPGESMMDRFMKGLGVGNLSKLGSSNKDAASAKTKSPLEDDVQVPVPKPEDTQLPGRPVKVQLSMAEKQRLAQQQENQQRLQSQTPLQPKTNLTNGTTKSKPKDLTSTLRGNDLMSTNSTSGYKHMTGSYGNMSSSGVVGPSSTMGSSSTMGMANTIGLSNSTGSSSIMGSSSMLSPVGASTGPSFMGGPGPGMTGGQSPYGQPGMGSGQMKQQQNKSINMSSLDNLLPSKPRPSMNQMQPQPRPAAMAPMRPQGMMGNQMGMMGNQGMTGYGMTRMNTMQPQGMMGNSQQNTGTKLSSQELDDFLK